MERRREEWTSNPGPNMAVITKILLLLCMAIFELAIAIPNRASQVSIHFIFDVEVNKDDSPNNNQNCPCCPFDWNPVCGGYDGHTMSFSNQCFLNEAIKCDTKFENYKFLHEEECYVCSPRCLKGKCVGPNTCNCNQGWTGSICDTHEFETFKSRFNKKFKNAMEEEKRRLIFYENLRTINEHNIMYKSGKSSFKMGINEFCDMTHDEVISTMTGLKVIQEHRVHTANPMYSPVNIGKEPDSINYVDLGHLNPIRHQGLCNCTGPICGSCWAFSTIATLESHISLEYSTLVRLSAQDLVSCDKTNEGCNGGRPDKAMEWIKSKGIALEIGYPFTSGEAGNGDGVCYSTTPKTSYSVTDIQQVIQQDLQNALAFSGPVSVGIFLSPSFQHYKSGVFEGTDCPADTSVHQLNHAVVIVGYGWEAGKAYWLVRNSHGTKWGENGYIRMSRQVLNICGISNWAFIPLVTGPCPLTRSGGPRGLLCQSCPNTIFFMKKHVCSSNQFDKCDTMQEIIQFCNKHREKDPEETLVSTVFKGPMEWADAKAPVKPVNVAACKNQPWVETWECHRDNYRGDWLRAKQITGVCVGVHAKLDNNAGHFYRESLECCPNRDPMKDFEMYYVCSTCKTETLAAIYAQNKMDAKTTTTYVIHKTIPIKYLQSKVGNRNICKMTNYVKTYKCTRKEPPYNTVFTCESPLECIFDSYQRDGYIIESTKKCTPLGK